MSTRYLTVVVSGGEYKVAQYGQSDGGPSWAGARILDFLSNNNIKKLKESVAKVRFLSSRIMRNTMDIGGPRVTYEFAASERPEQEDWLTEFFSREIGCEILKSLCKPFGKKVFLNNDIGFAGNSFLCKYVYLVDLDKSVLEVYRGDNEKPVTSGRFLSSDPVLDRCDGSGEPVVLVKTYKLKSLPDEVTFIRGIEEACESLNQTTTS